MTVLQALDRYYERMAARGEAEPPGFTRENISFALVLGSDGSIRNVIDLRVASGKKLLPTRLSVPRPKRTSNVQANFLWDKTAYMFGVDGGKSKRLEQEHSCFCEMHRRMLSNARNEHTMALLAFLEDWRPDRFKEYPFQKEMIDTSFVLMLEGERRFFHDVPELRKLWLSSLDEQNAPSAFCLVTGQMSPIEVSHPVIKGVMNAQSSGAYLVSANADAYASYGKPNDATNSPTSKVAAARYGAALNGMLERGSRNRLARGIGDATVVFWADTSATADEAAAQAAEDFFAALIEPPDDAGEARRLREGLENVVQGRPVDALDLGLQRQTRFHVLGLAPNAARLSVRYWLSDDFSAFVERLAAHYRDLAIEPSPWGNRRPAIGWLLLKTTAVQEKYENIPPLLAGEVARAVLEGTRYPRSLLAAAIMRLRAGDDPSTGWHAAVIRAVLARDQRLKRAEASPSDHPEPSREDLPVSLQRDNPDPAYQLGRLFAAYETAQRMALGKVNATIRDRYFGAASATPASVFPLLMRGSQNHLGKLRKAGKGAWLEREIEEIVGRLGDHLPRSLALEAQGRFVLGYYHQRKGQFASREAEAELASTDAEDNDHDE